MVVSCCQMVDARHAHPFIAHIPGFIDDRLLVRPKIAAIQGAGRHDNTMQGQSAAAQSH